MKTFLAFLLVASLLYVSAREHYSDEEELESFDDKENLIDQDENEDSPDDQDELEVNDDDDDEDNENETQEDPGWFRRRRRRRRRFLRLRFRRFRVRLRRIIGVVDCTKRCFNYHKCRVKTLTFGRCYYPHGCNCNRFIWERRG